METKRCRKCRMLMVLVHQETDDGPVPGNPMAVWRCGCGNREYAGYLKREEEPAWLVRWRQVNHQK